MTTTTTDLQLARLLREARDEDAAVLDLQDCMDRLSRARAAKVALAALPAEQLRRVLLMVRQSVTEPPR